MKTATEWTQEFGVDKNVCTGHGDYDDLPKRMNHEMIRKIQQDAFKAGQLDVLNGICNRLEETIKKIEEHE